MGTARAADGGNPPKSLGQLVHLSPLGWEHVNLTGDYVWASTDQATENPDGFRPLRPLPDVAWLAA